MNIFRFLRSFILTIIVSLFVAIIYYTSVFYFSRGISISVSLVISFKRRERATSINISKLIILVVFVMWTIYIIMSWFIISFTEGTFRGWYGQWAMIYPYLWHLLHWFLGQSAKICLVYQQLLQIFEEIASWDLILFQSPCIVYGCSFSDSIRVWSPR